MENSTDTPDTHGFYFDPKQYAELRKDERANSAEARVALALEHIADDLSAMRSILCRMKDKG
jgi:hypothetical protein